MFLIKISSYFSFMLDFALLPDFHYLDVKNDVICDDVICYDVICR